MPFITLLNTSLDLKIVQWGLLVGCTILLFFIGVLTLKNGSLKLENALLKKEVAETSEALHIQNQKILELAEKTKEYQTKVLTTQKEASKIALQTTKTLQGIAEYQFKGECSQNVSQALIMIKESIGSINAK